MKKVDINNVTALDLRDVLQHGRLVITHKDKPKFALISLHDLNLLESMQMEDLQESEDEFHIEDMKLIS